MGPIYDILSAHQPAVLIGTVAAASTRPFLPCGGVSLVLPSFFCGSDSEMTLAYAIPVRRRCGHLPSLSGLRVCAFLGFLVFFASSSPVSHLESPFLSSDPIMDYQDRAHFSHFDSPSVTAVSRSQNHGRLLR